jgi:predicted HTH domain antitoxin
MTTMTLNVPEALEKEHDRTVRLIATKLYEAGEVTLGQAAEMAGMKRMDFAAVMVDYGVNIYELSLIDDLERMKSGKL